MIKIAKRTRKSMKWCDHGMTMCDDHASGTYTCVYCGQHLQDGLNYRSGWIDRIVEARKKKDKELGIVDVYNPYMTKEMANYE